MMKFKMAVAAAALLAGTSGALAADLDNGPSEQSGGGSGRAFTWTGFYIGGQAGYGITNHNLTSTSTEHFDAVPSKCWAKGDLNLVNLDNPMDDREHDVNVNGGASITNVTEEECKDILGGDFVNISETDPVTGHNYSVSSGYDEAVDEHDVVTKSAHKHSDSGVVGGLHLGFDKQLGRFVVGIFAEYNWGDLDGLNGEWAAGGRAGYLLDPRLLAFVLLAYTQADYDNLGTYEGWKFGGGLEYALERNVFVGAKYTYSDYEEQTIVNVPGLNVRDDMDEHRIMGTLSIKLNSDLGSLID